MSKITPGPWNAGVWTYTLNDSGCVGVIPIITPRPVTHEESRANALAIGVVPEMLTALRLRLTAQTPREYADAHVAEQAAYKKAMGEE